MMFSTIQISFSPSSFSNYTLLVCIHLILFAYMLLSRPFSRSLLRRRPKVIICIPACNYYYSPTIPISPSPALVPATVPVSRIRPPALVPSIPRTTTAARSRPPTISSAFSSTSSTVLSLSTIIPSAASTSSTLLLLLRL